MDFRESKREGWKHRALNALSRISLLKEGERVVPSCVEWNWLSSDWHVSLYSAYFWLTNKRFSPVLLPVWFPPLLFYWLYLNPLRHHMLNLCFWSSFGKCRYRKTKVHIEPEICSIFRNSWNISKTMCERFKVTSLICMQRYRWDLSTWRVSVPLVIRECKLKSQCNYTPTTIDES